MAKRLNDTVAVRSMPCRDGWMGPNPDAGTARCARPQRGEDVTVRPNGHERLLRAPADAGSESLRGATMYLGEKL